MSSCPALIVLHALAMGLVTPVVAASPPSLSEVEGAIRTKGSRETLHMYFDCDVSGEAAYSQVARGGKGWIDVAARLLPDADGCYATLLRHAIARSLSVKPEAALALVGTTPMFSPYRVCIPFLSEDDPVKQHRAYLAKLEAALRAVRDEKLQGAKDACLLEVEKTRKRLK